MNRHRHPFVTSRVPVKELTGIDLDSVDVGEEHLARSITDNATAVEHHEDSPAGHDSIVAEIVASIRGCEAVVVEYKPDEATERSDGNDSPIPWRFVGLPKPVSVPPTPAQPAPEYHLAVATGYLPSQQEDGALSFYEVVTEKHSGLSDMDATVGDIMSSVVTHVPELIPAVQRSGTLPYPSGSA